MRVVFFGSPEFAVPSLDALVATGHDVVAVVTQPDRPRTRSHSTLLPTPVKARATALGIPVLQPERPRGDEFLHAIRDLRPDLGVVVAYGHILRPELLAIPRLGMVNVHASLLPRWRGAAPIHWALLAGDTQTGVSIMRMEEGLDSGPVWLRREVPLEPGVTTGDLFRRLATLGAEALVEALPRIERGDVPEPQDASLVTFAPKVDRATARVDWTRPAAEVVRLINAMDPVPGAWTTIEGKAIKLYEASIGPRLEAPPNPLLPPGHVSLKCLWLTVAAADGWVDIGRVTEEGHRRRHSDDFVATRSNRYTVELPPLV